MQFPLFTAGAFNPQNDPAYWTTDQELLENYFMEARHCVDCMYNKGQHTCCILLQIY